MIKILLFLATLAPAQLFAQTSPTTLPQADVAPSPAAAVPPAPSVAAAKPNDRIPSPSPPISPTDYRKQAKEPRSVPKHDGYSSPKSDLPDPCTLNPKLAGCSP